MKTTTETETLQQHPQANAERAPRQAARKRRENGKKEKAAELHTGGVRRPSYLDADARPLGVTAATAQSFATLNHLNLLPHCGRIAHGTQPLSLSQNGIKSGPGATDLEIGTPTSASEPPAGRSGRVAYPPPGMHPYLPTLPCTRNAR